jgi:regulator of replication initiation timing
MPNGPKPHVILETSDVRIQRLQKKIRKLILQRDHWKSKYDKLASILEIYPYLFDRYEKYEEQKAKRRRLADYDAMVPLLVNENEKLKAENERLKKTP